MPPWIVYLIAPIIGALVGFAVWHFQSKIESIRRAQERLQDTRRQLYADILDPYIRLFAGMDDQQVATEVLQQVVSFEYKRTAFEFSLVGSDTVVKSFNDMMQFFYRTSSAGREPEAAEMLQYWGGFLLEIRRSIGDPKTKLSKKDMLRGLVTDIDEVMPE